MAETVDWNDEKDPRVVQHRIRLAREQHEAEQIAKQQGIGVLRGFTDGQLLDELERRHPDFPAGSSGTLKYAHAQGSGSYKYNEPVDWTKTQGAGLSADTSAAALNATDLIHTDPHNLNLPTQEQADAVVAKAEAEREQRAAEAGQALSDSQGQQNAEKQVQGS